MTDDITVRVVEDTGDRMVTVYVTGAPDITPDQSYITFNIRPSTASLRYAISDGRWVLEDVEVRGRSVDTRTGQINKATRRTYGVVYRDLTNKGGIQKARTPDWVVTLAKNYTNPDKLL